MNENKKISFGFSKLVKKPSILPESGKVKKQVDFIECIEGSEIKVKNATEKVEKGPLVIDIKGDANVLLSRIREGLKCKNVRPKEEDTRPDSELTIEELAARQLLREARDRLVPDRDTVKVHLLPVAKEHSVENKEVEESSIEDYENVPISDYGLAMLRGMGWKEGMSIGKSPSNSVKPPEPELRPKGLGLGAQRIIETNHKDVFDQNGKQLVLTKGAFAKIVAGTHKGKFAEVLGLDEESGRVILKTTIFNEILTLNELFVIPITNEEFAVESKVINNVKYEKYKEIYENVENENKVSQDKSESRSNHPQNSKYQQNERKFCEDRVKIEHDSSNSENSSTSELRKYETSKYSSDEASRKRKSRSKSKKCDRRRSRSRNKSYDRNSKTKYSHKKERDYSDIDNKHTKYQSSRKHSGSSHDDRHQSRQKYDSSDSGERRSFEGEKKKKHKKSSRRKSRYD